MCGVASRYRLLSFILVTWASYYISWEKVCRLFFHRFIGKKNPNAKKGRKDESNMTDYDKNHECTLLNKINLDRLCSMEKSDLISLYSSSLVIFSWLVFSMRNILASLIKTMNIRSIAEVTFRSSLKNFLNLSNVSPALHNNFPWFSKIGICSLRFLTLQRRRIIA